MNRTQLHNRLCLGERGLMAPIHRLYALVLVCFAILASMAGTSDASSRNVPRVGAAAPANNPSAGIRDPMNPDAYMRDLAARMKPADQKVLLGGAGAPRVTPTSQGPIVQTAPVMQNAPAAQGSPVVRGVPIVRSAAPRVGSPSTVQNNAAVSTPGAPAGVTAGTATPPSVVPATSPQVPSAAPMPSAVPEPAAGVPSGAQAVSELQNVASPSVLPEPVARTNQAPTPAVETAPKGPSPLDGPLTTVPAGAPLPAMLAAPAGSGSNYQASAAGMGSPSLGTYPTGARTPMPRGPGSVQRALITGTSGLTLWEEPKLASQIGQGGAGGVPQPPKPKEPWTLNGDLDKYRAHAVKDGSRNSGENLKKALERAGMTLSDGANVFLLGYASDRAKPFRENDGKGLFQEPGKVPQRAGATIGDLGLGLYSILDLATLNALPDPKTPVYEDNNPLVRPLLFTGRTVGGVWKTTEEVGNALTWGLFDNVTGCVGLVIEDIVELVKHAGEAVTNVARAPFHLAAGKKPHEKTDETLDWVLLVPLELVSNAVEMKGISNTIDYETAFAEKGVIGSLLEFGGSTYIVYRAVDKLADQLKSDKPHRARQPSQQQNSQPGGSNTQPPGNTNPPTDTVPPAAETPVEGWVYYSGDGSPIDPVISTDAWWNQGWPSPD